MEGKSEQISGVLLKRHPEKRPGTPEDFAKLALFLASNDALWMTGTATIDGGIMAAN